MSCETSVGIVNSSLNFLHLNLFRLLMYNNLKQLTSFSILPCCLIVQTSHFIFYQDVESYDPILNPVLNRELRRTGGRVLITIGDQDIDLSPSFTIFLSTRDPTVNHLLLLSDTFTH